MKRWFILAVAMMVVAGVQAKKKGKGGIAKEKFVAVRQKRAEAAGKSFDAAKAEAVFAKKDKNGDGLLSRDERKSKGKKKPSKGTDK